MSQIYSTIRCKQKDKEKYYFPFWREQTPSKSLHNFLKQFNEVKTLNERLLFQHNSYRRLLVVWDILSSDNPLERKSQCHYLNSLEYLIERRVWYGRKKNEIPQGQKNQLTSSPNIAKEDGVSHSDSSWERVGEYTPSLHSEPGPQGRRILSHSHLCQSKLLQ